MCQLLIERCRKLITSDRRTRLRRAAKKLGCESAGDALARLVKRPRMRWDASPVSTARMGAGELERNKGGGLVAAFRTRTLPVAGRSACGISPSIISSSEKEARALERALTDPLRLLWRIANMAASLRVTIFRKTADLMYDAGSMWDHGAFTKIPLAER